MGSKSTLLAILCASIVITAGGFRSMEPLRTPENNNGCDQLAHPNSNCHDEMKKECVEDLRHILRQQHDWIKVHAAEFLLQLGHPEGVKEEFIKQNQQFAGKSPYRIGIWRVLAQSEGSQQKKQRWVSNIKDAFLDPQGNDRLHAIETLAKLKTSLQREHPVEVEEALNSATVPMALYSRWSTAYTDEQSLVSVRSQFIEWLMSADLGDPDQAAAIRLSSYVLRFLGEPEPPEWEALAAKVIDDTNASPVRSTLLSTLYLIHPSRVDGESLKRIKEELVEKASKGMNVPDLMIILAEKGDKEDIRRMRQWFEKMRDTSAVDYDADVHATAAFLFARLLTRMQSGERYSNL